MLHKTKKTLHYPMKRQKAFIFSYTFRFQISIIPHWSEHAYSMFSTVVHSDSLEQVHFLFP